MEWTHSLVMSGVESVAAIVAHELNNISVPLDGFAEIAMQNLSPSSPERQFLDEMLIGIGRVQALAYQLECLAESESSIGRFAIAECLPASDGRQLHGPWTIQWDCDTNTTAIVDRLHARRAIEALLNTAWKPFSRPPAACILTVSQTLPREAECATCGTFSKYKPNDIRLQPDNSRPFTEDSLRDPFGPGGARRAGQRLGMAVLVHCAHQAGGHLLLERSSGALSLALPAS